MSRMPDFLFIGGARCASTWLHECLSEHPGTCVPRRPKELNFFNRDENYARGTDWYADFWEHREAGQIRGEVTPTYLCHTDSPKRIYETCPDVKFIACLRNPIDRTYSAYRGHILAGRIDPGITVKEASSRLTFDNQSSLIDHSFYHQHLTRYFDLFPRERFLIYLYNDVSNDPSGVIRRVFEFLHVDPDFMPSTLTEKVNTGFRLGSGGAAAIRTLNRIGQAGKSFAPRVHRYFEMGVRVLRNRIVKPETTAVPPEIVDELLPIYREENDKLAALLGVDLSHWNRGADE